MSLDLRNFVNINIKYNSTNISSVERGIVTLITQNTNFPADFGTVYSADGFAAVKKAKSISDSSLDNYVASFFGNKGKGLQIIGGYSTGDVAEWMLGVLKELDYKYVIIVSDVSEQVLRSVAAQSPTTKTIVNPLTNTQTVPTFSGLNEKLFISSTTDTSGKLFNFVSGDSAPTWQADTYYSFNSTSGQYELTTSEPADWSTDYATYFVVASSVNASNYIIKVGEKGIEMLAAAYLSKVRITDASTIQDYAFTIENVKAYFPNSVIDDNDTGVALTSAHLNFDTELVNAIRNYPGDMIDGVDMMNYYIKIILTQDLTESIINLLASKIKFNQTGINRLNNAISQTMNTYITNGYLNTDYIWTEDDLYYSFNGVDYLVCSRNSPLVKGYKCVILPISSLTAAQKESHVLPPVYLLLADQTGIRMIVITGDVY